MGRRGEMGQRTGDGDVGICIAGERPGLRFCRIAGSSCPCCEQAAVAQCWRCKGQIDFETNGHCDALLWRPLASRRVAGARTYPLRKSLTSNTICFYQCYGRFVLSRTTCLVRGAFKLSALVFGRGAL